MTKVLRRMLLVLTAGLCVFTSCTALDTTSEETDDRIVITIATWLDREDGAPERITRLFNESQDDIRVDLVTYDPGDTMTIEASLERAYMSFAAGNTPDLYHTLSFDAAKLRNGGLIEDWYPVMLSDASFNMDEYQTHIWELLETDGKLYQLAASFNVFGIGGPAEIYEGLSGFTIDEFQAFLDEYADKLYIEQERMLQIMLWYGSHLDFIDKETMTCDFESEDFLEMLAFLSELPVVPQSGTEVNVARVQSADNHHTRHKINGYYSRIVGAPSRYGAGPGVAIGDTFALSVNTENKDACWTFMKWLLSYETQAELYMDGDKVSIRQEVPIRLDVWEESLQRSMLGGEDENSLFYGHTTGDGEFIDGKFFPEYVDGLPAEEVEYLRQLVANADRTAIGFFDYKSITAIVEEEVLAYLAGDKSTEECAHLIQNRVSTLLAETR